ncbi:uncharacterized protein LOC135393366 [Ornithodoros turicata]|uniref:uncharacterized protein LOC135393366 n=1 Tax=Ornithodoros turicata TaxID=34597 RepID=UPI00313A26D9
MNHTGAKASAYAKALGKFDSYFMLGLMIPVFGRLESANSALQKKSLQFGHTEQTVKTAKECVAELRDKFPGFWIMVKATAEELKTGCPSLPIRQRQGPRRYDEGSQAHEFKSTEAYYGQRFHMVIDAVHASLCTRFPAGMWDHVTKIEKFLVGKTDSGYLCEFYKGDLDARRLQLHRDMLLDTAKQHSVSLASFQDVKDLLSGKESEPLWTILPEVVQLLRIVLTIHVTSCTSEKSFSCLRWLKTYLRSTTGQARLNHITLLHCHKELARDSLLAERCSKRVHQTNNY